MFRQSEKLRAPYWLVSLGGVVDLSTRVGSLTGQVGMGYTALAELVKVLVSAVKNHSSHLFS